MSDEKNYEQHLHHFAYLSDKMLLALVEFLRDLPLPSRNKNTTKLATPSAVLRYSILLACFS
jgi:hypothetical protein